MPDIAFSSATTSQLSSITWVDQIPVIELTTLAPVVTLKIVMNGHTVHSVDLYPFKGELSSYISDIIREEMESEGLTLATISLVVSSEAASPASLNFQTLYRRRYDNVKATEFCKKSFLTLYPIRKLPSAGGDNVYLFLAAGEAVDISMEVKWKDFDGHIQSDTATETFGPFSFNRIYSFDIEWPVSLSGFRPVAMAMTAGERRVVWYWIPGNPSVFNYDNAFGVNESFYCRTSVDRKITLKGSMAKVMNSLIRYDEEETEEITVTLPPALPSDQLILSQIPGSRKLYWAEKTGDDFQKIVITQSEINAEEDPEELSRPQFTFRRDSTFPEVPWPTTGRIFTEPFKMPFK